MINAARQPVILADVELHRFGLQPQLLRLARRTNIPWPRPCSAIGHWRAAPFYLGVYEGAMAGRGAPHVESSDCVILLGAFLTDINLGVFTARLDPARSIYATSEKLSIRYTITKTCASRFLQGLLGARVRRRRPGRWPIR